MQLYQLTSESDLILVPIGDLHIGDKCSRLDLVRQAINYVKHRDNARVVLLGDILNVATKTSPGAGPFDQNMDTTDQIKLAVELFSPIKDQIITSLTGNHCDRLSNHAGLDIAELLALSLNVPYGGFSSVINLTVGKQAYTVYLTHGHGGGTTKSGVLNAIKKLANIYPGADVYLRGHSHQFMVVPERTFTGDNGQICPRDRYYVDTGSFTDYLGSYAERANYQPVIPSCWSIKFSAKRHNIKIMPLL